jgi:type I restriction enzyme S subunit
MSNEAMSVQEVSPGYAFVAENPAVPVGYKQTEVGVIPEEWEITTVGTIARISSGGTPLRSNSEYWKGDIPWITTTEVDFCTIYQASQFITEAGLNNSAAKLLPPGTLLIALYGQGKTRGKTAVLGIKAATNQACASIEITRRDVYRDYIFHRMVSMYDQIRGLSNTGNQENLNGSLVRSIPIILPQETEQKTIATALSDMDALLEELDRLIAKKRDIKQAAMQQLLTGETRLPGFEGEWITIPLGSLGRFLKGSGIKRDDAMSGTLPCVRYGEIYTLHNDVIREFHSWISDEVAQSAVPIQKGDVLFAGSGETKEEIGKSVALVDEVAAYAGGDIVILRTSNADPTFLGYALNQPDVIRQKSRFGQGDAVVHISAVSLAKVIVKIPCFEEQEAIAAVLSDMDAEIQALEQRRNKTAELKQGMMQELLTGRTRLV